MSQLSLLLLLTALPASAASVLPGNCPDLTMGETSADCPWAAVARSLQADAAAGRPLAPTMSAQISDLVARWKKDSRRTEWLSLWGTSINFDENAKGVIVSTAILQEISTRVGATFEDRPDRRVHAGITHVYGYLFSTLKTPYGYKRARWVGGEIEGGVGLPPGTFGPLPADGTQLSNATYFLGRIAFRGDKDQDAALARRGDWAAKSLRDFAFQKLTVRRRVDEVTTSSGTRVELRYDVVDFLSPGTGGNSQLLVMSVLHAETGKTPAAALITAFPVAAGFSAKLFEPTALGPGPVDTRYNAFVEGVTGAGLAGIRRESSTVPFPATRR